MHENEDPIERLDLRGNLRALHPKDRKPSHKVPFETPFALWCTTCPKPTIIAERTKFMADKSTVASTNSRPLYSYRIRHILCGGAIEFRTTLAAGYKVVEGGQKKSSKDGVFTEDDFRILTAGELAEKKAKAFALLEYQAEEAEKEKKMNQRTLDLYEASKQFEYPFMPKKEVEALRIAREQRDFEPMLLEAPTTIDRADHIREINEIMRRQKKMMEKKVLKDEGKVKRANKAFASSVSRNTRAKLDPFRNAGSIFGAPQPREKKRRLLEGLQSGKKTSQT